MHLKTRTVDSNQSASQARTGIRKHWRAGRSHYLLQFPAPISDDTRAALSERGAVITSSVPDDAVVVAVGPDFTAVGLGAVFAQEVDSQDKVSPLTGSHGNDLGFVVEFHADVTPEEAHALLLSEGLTTVEHPDLTVNHVLVLGTVIDAERIRNWDEVAYIFPAAPEMLQGDRFHNCPGALSNGNSVAQYVRMGHGWTADAKGQVNLGYVFGALSSKVPDDVVKGEVIRAMNEWMKYARITFSAGLSSTAPRTITVKFAARDHNDGYPFDGPNGVLAHTFYPANPEPVAGDMHMDAEEGWHAGTNIDVYTVALHELGHALGLGHSDQPGAIMYPYYRYPSQISPDDIAGIQSIYGTPQAGAPNPGAPTATPAAPAIPVMTMTAQSSTASPLPANMTAVTFSGTVSNPSGAVVVTWQTDRGASGRATGGIDWTTATIPTPAGTTTVTFTATDNQHRIASKVVTLIRAAPVTQDTIPPVLTISSPLATTVQTTLDKLAITGTATDNVDVTRVTWQNNNVSSGVAVGTKTWSVAAIPLLVGTNSLIIRAYDAAGNSTWRSITVTRR